MRTSPPLRLIAASITKGVLVLGIFLATLLIPGALSAQNAVTGALTGVVVDPSGAVLPGASVKIVDTATNSAVTVTTNAQGRYTASLLKPSKYEITVNGSGMTSRPTTVNVLVGQTPSVDITVSLQGANTSIDVSAQAAQLTDTQSPASILTLTQSQIENLPAPGGDITTVAFTAPGVVLNSGGAYGNFSSDGLPGTSNLFVLNGYDAEDPFLNLNNSGSSNLTLGQGEISEAAVVQNGYGVQYGRAAGVIINWTTKSGGNKFHGAANYFYNGTVLNANDWFNKQEGGARPHAVSNQWAANGGGPIIKDKLFFFVDYEGLRYSLPSQGYAAFPTAAFQAAVLKNIPAANVPFYQQAFALYNSSPNFANAVPVVTGNGQLQDSTGSLGCGSAAGLPDGNGGTFGVTTSCTAAVLGQSSNINKEWLLTGRVDWHISDKNQIFGRYKMDRGTQPTYTNYVNPLFNTVSSQPSYEGQLNDTYIFSPHVTNQFIFASNWYTAYFGPANLAATLAAFPTYFAGMIDGGSNGSSSAGGTLTLGMTNDYINGRNVTQYQFVDDLSILKGSHTLRFGYNFRRNDISDYDSQQNLAGAYELYLGDFANGTITNGFGSAFSQQLTTPNATTAHLALYNIGVYAQDEWQATSRLKLTYGIRFDRTGNPLCNDNCFTLYNGGFPQSNVSTSTPYNKLLNANLSHPFASVPKINPQARFGFNYDVAGDGRTVIRGGFGMFTDLYPAGFLDNFVANLPNVYAANIGAGSIGPSTLNGSAAFNSGQSFNAVTSGFAHGASSSSLMAAVPGFATPEVALTSSEFKNPTYLEFNLQVQHQFTKSDAVILAYAGNTGYDGIATNPGANASSPTGFGGLPTAQPDPNFAAGLVYYNGGHSNYNGASVTYKHIDSKGLTVDVSYTYSKSLDDVSNGGTGEYYNTNSYFSGTRNQINPLNLRSLNYGLSDYDIRNSLQIDFVYDMPFHFQNLIENQVLGGWIVAGKSFYRSGQPFSVYNSAAVSQNLANGNNVITSTGVSLVDFKSLFNINRHCGASAAVTPCISASSFVDPGSQADFGNVARNQFFGPHYADTDLSLSKRLYRHESLNLQIGANAFNVFNHPNFALPGGDINGGGLGVISSIAAPPTSPYGSFQGAGVGGRVVQVFGKFSF